ncbi:MAG: hypothetical protein IPM25_03590 [Chloracidobacterium sp.]|nr:hypothetical protein [Chloracidobacterium sp.]
MRAELAVHFVFWVPGQSGRRSRREIGERGLDNVTVSTRGRVPTSRSPLMRAM